jgi:hypothetical protein
MLTCYRFFFFFAFGYILIRVVAGPSYHSGVKFGLASLVEVEWLISYGGADAYMWEGF